MRVSAEPEAGQARRGWVTVVAVGLAAVAVKLVVAATTTGTDDVLFFRSFAKAIAQVGPVDVYGARFLVRYNHPPLIGLLLGALDWLDAHGLPFRFALRSVPVMADFGSSLLVFDVLRRRCPVRTATVTAGLVAVNPILFIVSGFHGNTDSVFVFLTLLAAWLLLDCGAPALAGLALAAAGGVKLVPLILLPIFLVLLRRRADLARFCGTFASATVLLWAPAVLRELPAIRRNVVGYAGHQEDWGVVLIARVLGHPGRMVELLAGPGRYLLILASVAPAVLWAWGHPERGYAAIALALVSFLALSPAWAPQYLAWPVVFGYLWNRRMANAYSVAGACVLVYTYTRWSGGFPWDWAHARALDRGTVLLGVVAWLVLLAWTVLGLRESLSAAAAPDPARGGELS
jgi:Glycosyltransferase family 87